MAQVSLTAACNRAHHIEQRLARGLLMVQDRLRDHDEIGRSQEFLSHMLGVRIAGVNEAVKELERQAVISHRRGSIKIVSRGRLERICCECYERFQRDNARLFGRTAGDGA